MNKKGKSAETGHFLRFIIVATALAVVFMFIKKDNIIRWMQAGSTVRKQERQIENLKNENERLRQQIKSLTLDIDSLERFAREKYLFAREGDDVYLEQ